MPEQTKRRFDFFQVLVIFAVIYLGSQLVLPRLFPDKFGPKVEPVVSLHMQDSTLTDGHYPVVIVQNDAAAAFTVQSNCPMPPFAVRFTPEGSSSPQELSTTETKLPCPGTITVAPKAKATIDLGPWMQSLFSQHGSYELSIQSGSGNLVTSFTLGEPGAVTKLFRAVVTKPLLNLLVFIASLTPGHNLGIAIIVLTILVKLLLFLPTQHSMQGQRKLQALQPKIDELRKKYKDDPKVLNEHVMKLWKENNVNPFQSCMPVLIQFPILIGLFFTVRDGSHLALSQHLLYPPYQDLPWTFGTHFVGFDLLVPSVFIFPPVLVLLQFLQMKLSFATAKRKAQAAGKEDKPLPPEQKMQQRMMLYGLPLMIGAFAWQFPAAVSLYWFVSTAFAIGQQWLVNRKG